MLPPFVKDRRGMRLGRLLVVEFVEVKNRRSRWMCLCDCGNKTIVNGSNLRAGQTQSCGCLTKDRMREIGLKRPSGSNVPPGKTKNRLQKIYRGMLDRCTKTTRSAWDAYGGRGITVCSEWVQSFDVFYDWAVANGYSHDLTLDRIDNDRGYCPENCRWATKKQQANNRRSSVFFSAFGETKTLAQWLEDPRRSVSIPTIKSRLAKGWSFEQAISVAGMTKRECALVRFNKGRNLA